MIPPPPPEFPGGGGDESILLTPEGGEDGVEPDHFLPSDFNLGFLGSGENQMDAVLVSGDPGGFDFLILLCVHVGSPWGFGRGQSLDLVL